VDRRWYQSLYWRIALGLFAFLALMLAAEAALFLWTTDRIAGSMPARSPRRLAVLVASDVGTAIAANPSLDLQQYVRDQYGEVLQTFLVIMRDGRVVANHEDVPEDLLDAVRAEVELPGLAGRLAGLRARRGARPRSPDGPIPGAIESEADLGARRQPPRIRGEFAPIRANGATVGRVAVLPEAPPFSRVLRQLGPTIAVMAGGVLLVGTALIAFVVFGPVRGRLMDVQWATERLGMGDLSARAPEEGGDEVAALARSFNRMAEDLAGRARALAASDKARRQLLADVSHELMTPLTAMRGYIETLAMSELSLEPTTRERYLRIVAEETHRLERIIGDLLDLARLEGGGTTIRREPVDVAAVFDRVAARHEREVRDRNIRLLVSVGAGAERLGADPDRLEQALQNLAANALRHTPDGGGVLLEASALPDSVRLVVRDSGPGIAAEHLPLIFDRFYKVDASRRASGGSGLGLSIVKAIVERHGGTITARNDGGAVFEIVLPRGNDEEREGHDGDRATDDSRRAPGGHRVSGGGDGSARHTH
jgi:signal transduction histidine kinase